VGPAARAVAEEIAELRQRVAVEVETVDERLTTRAAAHGLRAGGRRHHQQRGLIDQSAATLLLQTWVEQRLSAEGTRP
jgi:putative Holliday junction resolvase